MNALPRLWFLTCLVLASVGMAAPPRPPNTVLFLVDDLGWKDLGCQGSSFYETPHIDRLAEQGMRFTDAYANCPVCSPSRAAILTGQYPARTGFTGHITAIGRHRYPPHGRIVPPDDYMFLRHELVTLAEAIEPAGYVSASIGKWHLGSKEYWPERQGFDVNIAGYDHGSPPAYFFPYTSTKSWNPSLLNLDGGRPGEYLTDRLTDEAVRFIETNRGQPFFLYLSHYAVHTPLQAPDTLIAKYQAKLAEDDSQISAVYAAMVEKVDDSVGRLTATLKELDLQRETLFIFTSDNGGYSGATRNAPLRSAKGHLYEGGIRVPLIVRWPGKVDPGTVSTTPVTAADLYPTIAEAVGEKASPGAPLDGRSLMPLLTGDGDLAPRDLYWYYPHYSPHRNRPGAVIRSGNYKLIQFYDPPAVELYDLTSDVGEQSNLTAGMPERTAELHGQLSRWLKATAATRHTSNPDYDPDVREDPQ